MAPSSVQWRHLLNYRRILLLVILTPIAWRWGPGLFDWLSSVSPSFGTVLDFFIPSAAGKGGDFWIKFLAGLFIFWVIAKLSGPIFGFTGAKSQQYGTTKSARRFQGFVAEAMIVGILFGVISLAGGGASFKRVEEESGNEETRRLLREFREGQRNEKEPVKPDAGQEKDQKKRAEFEEVMKELRKNPEDPKQREYEDAIKRLRGDPQKPHGFKPPNVPYPTAPPEQP